MNKIICLDETSVGSALKPTYSRCELGRRCVIKTSNQFVFRKFTLLVGSLDELPKPKFTRSAKSKPF
jgi:hypothetical protein